MAVIKAKDMIQEQITHAFCSFCNYRRMVAGETHWGCNVQENKKDELCPYRQELQKEEENEAGLAH
jgi:hypothetical protein